MKLTWLGHSCFLAEQDGYTILLDPYTGVEGYPSLAGRRLRVHSVLCSHDHFDHNAADQAEAVPFEGPCPFAVRAVETFHDDKGGALRGTNTIHILSADGVAVAHLGDLGHPLSPEQVEAIGAKFTPVLDQATALLEVEAGTSDAAVIDYLMAAATVGEGTSYADLTYTCELNSEEYGVGFRKESDLVDALNDFFKSAYADGTMQQIADNYGIGDKLIVQK